MAKATPKKRAPNSRLSYGSIQRTPAANSSWASWTARPATDAAALARFQRATQLDAAFTDARVALGRTLVKLGRGADAIAPLLTAEGLQPEDPQTHFQLAQAYRQAGRNEDAARELRLHWENTQRIEKMDDQVRRGIQGVPDKQP